MLNNIFLSTPSARRATLAVSTRTSWWSNFYPRPPRGGRPQWASTQSKTGGFLSTPSARRATFCSVHLAGFAVISIHALREEGDAFRDALSCVEP